MKDSGSAYSSNNIMLGGEGHGRRGQRVQRSKVGDGEGISGESFEDYIQRAQKLERFGDYRFNQSEFMNRVKVGGQRTGRHVSR